MKLSGLGMILFLLGYPVMQSASWGKMKWEQTAGITESIPPVSELPPSHFGLPIIQSARSRWKQIGPRELGAGLCFSTALQPFL